MTGASSSRAVRATASALPSRWAQLARQPSCRRCLSSDVAPPPQAPISRSTGGGGGPLAKILRDSIRATGPISVARYMQFCLSHPTEGYYQKDDVFGRQGDFITSPEISQVFGELVAVWLLTRYIADGKGKRVRLVELGPGRGTLMDDVLRTLLSFPAIASKLSAVHLVENSESMRARQRERLEPRCSANGIALDWTDKIDDLPQSDEYTMLVAHEFFDAMPINVFEKREEGFREVMVDITPTSNPNSSDLRLTVSRSPTTLSTVLPTTSPRFANLPVGSRIEVSQDSWKIARKVGEALYASQKNRAGAGGGAGLIIDYGGDRTFGDSFRAFRHHKLVDVFDQPGSSDLTANVDFAYLRESLSGTGCRPLGPIPQSTFLLQLGLAPRLQKLLDAAPSPARRADLAGGAKRLVDPLGMGGQYQVMGLVSEQVDGEVYPFLPPPQHTDAPPRDGDEGAPAGRDET